MVKTTKTYGQLSEELDLVIAELQDPAVDIDRAVDLHKKGLEIIKKLEKYLAEAENSVKKISGIT